MGEWYNALMDYGAMLKRVGNPNVRSAAYAKQSKFRGSRRELRGAILRHLSLAGKATVADFQDYQSRFSVSAVLSDLLSEGFLKKEERTFTLA
jgi:A/G-specific adenine glycosylase